MSGKIVAITVTFNSSKFVVRAIDALLRQKKEIDHIVIVDNNSVAEDKEYIKEYIKNIPKISLLILEENLGGGGGFQAGMKYAREKFDPDWFWLMDDDAFPREDCLEQLLKHGNANENIGCLVPLIWGVDKKKYQLYHHKRESKFLTRDIQMINSIDDIQEKKEIESSAFVGPLISRRAVEKVGIADGSLFIYGDDLEYIYRISRQFKVYLIKSAVINHQDILMQGNIVNPKIWWKDYYQYRNRIFFICKYARGVQKTIGVLGFSCILLKKVLGCLIKREYKGYRLERTKILNQAWIDGIKNHRGKTVDPVQYMKYIEKNHS